MRYLRHLLTTAILGAGSLALAGDNQCDFTALEKPISVLSKPVSAIKGDPRVCDTVPPPTHSVWQSIQDPLDRSLGRIEDQQSYEISLIERSRFPLREFEQLQDQRERQLRIDQRQLRLDQLSERQRRQELDRREYIVYLYSIVSPMARQVETDRIALESAKADRDRALIDASNALNRALALPGADRATLQREYQQKRSEIRQTYEQTRARILGD